MALNDSRRKLHQTLVSGINLLAPGNDRAVLQLAEDWWGDYKDWEKKDTFKRALMESRLTVGQRPKENIIGTGTTSLGMFSAKNLPEKQQFPGYTFDTGVNGVKLRTDPKSFQLKKFQAGDDKLQAILDNPLLKKEYDKLGGIRGKYYYGLHDLSGSLLDPQLGKISQQLNSIQESGKLSWGIVFTPVPFVDDLVVFYLLNILAKIARGISPNHFLYTRVQEWRRKFTRIKLAQEDDMHCGLVDIAEKDAPLKRFRYGTGLVTEDKEKVLDEVRSKDIGMDVFTSKSAGRLTEQVMYKRQMDALGKDESGNPVILKRAREARAKREAEAEAEAKRAEAKREAEARRQAEAPPMLVSSAVPPPPPPKSSPPKSSPPNSSIRPADAQAAQGQIVAKLEHTGYNEIIIAYRQHESGRFPVYSTWNGQKLGFDCNPESGLTFVPDDWKSMPG
jgi:hypothetical protein